MSFEACKRCGQYGWTDRPCKCVRFQCVKPYKDKVDSEDDWIEIHALDAGAAAERFCDKWDCEGGEYRIVGNGGAEVWVRDEAGAICKFDVTAEAVPQYHARAKPEVSPP